MGFVEETRESDRSIRAEMYRHQDSFFFLISFPFQNNVIFGCFFICIFPLFSIFVFEKDCHPYKTLYILNCWNHPLNIIPFELLAINSIIKKVKIN